MGIISGIRPLFDCSSNCNGSGRLSGAFQTACELRGHFSRRLLPIACCSANEGRDSAMRFCLCVVFIVVFLLWLIGLIISRARPSAAARNSTFSPFLTEGLDFLAGKIILTSEV
jgi:hypothetical protein